MSTALGHYRPLTDRHIAPVATLGLPLRSASATTRLPRRQTGIYRSSSRARRKHQPACWGRYTFAQALLGLCNLVCAFAFHRSTPRAASHASVSSDHATRRPEIRWHEPGRISRLYQRPLTVVFAQPNPSPRVILGQVVGALARRRRPEDPSSGEIRHRWEVRLVGRARILQCRPKGR